MPAAPAAATIRPATREDYPQWLTLWQGYNHFYGRSGPTALPEAVTETTWSRFFDVYEPMRCLVAEQGGKLVGFVHYLYHRSTLAIAPYCYLHDLFTDETLRGQASAASSSKPYTPKQERKVRPESTGSPTKPTRQPESSTTRWPSSPASSSTARTFPSG